MSKLSALQVRNFKTVGRLSDGGGLYFEITAKGNKRWIYRYAIKRKQGVFVLGGYPEMSLSDARGKRDEARQLVKQGVNPAQERKREKDAKIAQQNQEKLKRENTFKKIALQWYELAKEGRHKGNAKPWSTKHVKDVLSSLERDVFPYIGDMPIDAITAPDIMAIIDSMTSRGVYDNTRKAVQRINQIFNFAIIKRRCVSNPTIPVQGLLPTHEAKNNPALFDKDLAELLKDLTAATHLHLATHLAIRFVFYTVLRSKEARLAKWDEVDLENKELRLTMDRTKRSRVHIVPLSRQAIMILEKAGEAFGKEGYLFPSPRDWNKPLSDHALSKAIRNLGGKEKYRGKQSIHGIRTSFRTMASDHTKYETGPLEMCINHKVGSKTEQAYNHSMYLKKRQKIMQWWGDKLHALEHGAEIIPISQVEG